MTLVKWTPTTRKPAFNIFDDINRMINYMAPELRSETDTPWYPNMDIKETKDCYDISLDLPGIDKKDIEISITEGVLKISGERKSEKKVEDAESIVNEINYGKFSRTLRLSEDVDENNISANFKNGVLMLKIVKVEPVKPAVKQIEIK